MLKIVWKKTKRFSVLLYHFLFTNHTRMLTLHIIFLTAWYRLRILLIPMARLEKTFGVLGKESDVEENEKAMGYAKLLCHRIERISKKTSWESKCLVQALVAQHLLMRKKIHSTLYLGVRHEENSLAAHAWLRCGYLCVTGGTGSEHTVVSCFYR